MKTALETLVYPEQMHICTNIFPSTNVKKNTLACSSV